MPTMLRIEHLLVVVDAYRAATGLEDVTLSHRLFSDSKKLGALRSGADITVTRFNAALVWLGANWPCDVSWPDGIERPAVVQPEPAE